MKGRRVGDRLKVSGICDVAIVLGNCPELTLGEIGHRIREHAKTVEIGIVAVIAITGPKARIDSELHEIGKALLVFVGSRGAATAQGAERLEVDRLGPL